MRYLLIILLVASQAACFGMGGKPLPVQYGEPAPQKTPDTKALVSSAIDTFEDSNFTENPSWWAFGGVKLELVPTASKGKALSIKGTATDWYVGGIGAYIAEKKDASSASSLEIDIFGTGPKSGTIKIELYDDDNANWQIEVDPKKGYAPMFDDRFVHELNIDWTGWKRVVIPFSEFTDTNREVGDNVWNPGRAGASGGLLQMQIIVVAATKTGTVDFLIDNIDIDGTAKK